MAERLGRFHFFAVRIILWMMGDGVSLLRNSEGPKIQSLHLNYHIIGDGGLNRVISHCLQICSLLKLGFLALQVGFKPH